MSSCVCACLHVCVRGWGGGGELRRANGWSCSGKGHQHWQTPFWFCSSSSTASCRTKRKVLPRTTCRGQLPSQHSGRAPACGQKAGTSQRGRWSVHRQCAESMPRGMYTKTLRHPPTREVNNINIYICSGFCHRAVSGLPLFFEMSILYVGIQDIAWPRSFIEFDV